MLISRIFSSLWLLFVIVYFFFTDSILGIILLIFTLLLGLLLWLNLRILTNKLNFDLRSDGTIHKHERGELSVHVKNNSWFPVARVQIKLLFRNQLTGSQDQLTTYIHVSSKSEEIISVDLESEYAGLIVVSLTEVSYYDFLGIFTKKIRDVNASTKIHVLPEYFPVSIDLEQSKLGLSNRQVYDANRKGTDGLEIFGIKEYTVDDSLKNIHWKLTSKFDELIVKELSEAVNYTFLILLDLTTAQKIKNPAVIDSLVDSFVSLSRGLLAIGYAHSIGWLDKKANYIHIEEVFSEEHLTSLLRQILSVSSVQSEESILEGFTYVSEPYSHVIQLLTAIQPNYLTDLDQSHLKTIIMTEEIVEDRPNIKFSTPENKRELLSHIIL